MFYYGMVLLAVTFFGLQFFFNRVYQQQCGSSWYTTFVFSLAAGLIGGALLLAINGFSLTVTPFTAIMAGAAAVNGLLFSFFAIRALGITNLSLFSVFSMIGGMALPFVTGILFYGEGITAAKILCFILIAVAMLFTVERGTKSGGRIYYVGVFVTNGLSGVLSMIFNSASYPKGTALDYSILGAIFRSLLAGAALLLMARRPHTKIRLTAKVGVSLAMGGMLSVVGNYLLLIALKHIAGSVQYPLVTGGVMIVSTIIGFFTASKPRKKDVLAVLTAFWGMLALLLPI